MHKSITALTVLLTAALSACVNGRVRDAQGGQALNNVQVDAYGFCSGAGCLGPDHGREFTYTNAPYGMEGDFVFDAYGDWWPASRRQTIGPGTGTEAIKLIFNANDGQHLTRTVYHRPKYEQFTSNGKQYAATFVPEVLLCKGGQVDTDIDSICDFAETKYGTNPNAVDSDGDGLSDSEELFGMACSGIDLRYYGANARHKDLYVYYDYYVKPTAGALAKVVQAFANAPLTNPDGVSGITLHLIEGKQVPANDPVYTPVFYDQINNQPNWKTPFNAIKAKYFPPAYTSFARYVLFGTRIVVPGPNYAWNGQTWNISGASKGTPAHDFLIATPPATSTEIQEAGTFMHELGHTLGLRHGGSDDVGNKPNYFSVMNYTYQANGLCMNNKDGRGDIDGILDYSRMTVGPVQEWSLIEGGLPAVSGMTAIGLTTSTELSRYRLKTVAAWGPMAPVLGDADGPLDFNSNVQIDTNPVQVNFNGNNTLDTIPASQNDWENLVYTGHLDGGGVLGCPAGYAKALKPQLVAASAPLNEMPIP